MILLPILAAAAWWSLRLAWADHLSRSPEPAGRRRAAALAPWSAAVYDRLADQLDQSGDDPVPALEHAAALEQENPRRFERLGQRAEFAGDLALAERSLLRAATLSRLYQPRYLLAQFYFRRQDRAAFDHWSREAFEVAPFGVTPLIELAFRIDPDPAALARRAPDRPSIARQFVFFLVRTRHTAAASGLARRVAETGGPEEVPPLLGFIEASLAEASAAPAEEVWNILCRRNLLAYREIDRASPVTNADFAHKPLNSAFDWHEEATVT